MNEHVSLIRYKKTCVFWVNALLGARDIKEKKCSGVVTYKTCELIRGVFHHEQIIRGLSWSRRGVCEHYIKKDRIQQK
jgi:hypothetical protein